MRGNKVVNGAGGGRDLVVQNSVILGVCQDQGGRCFCEIKAFGITSNSKITFSGLQVTLHSLVEAQLILLKCNNICGNFAFLCSHQHTVQGHSSNLQRPLRKTE